MTEKQYLPLHLGSLLSVMAGFTFPSPKPKGFQGETRKAGLHGAWRERRLRKIRAAGQRQILSVNEAGTGQEQGRRDGVHGASGET